MKIFGGKPDATNASNRAGRTRGSHEAGSTKKTSSADSSSADKVELSKDGAGLADAIRKAAADGLSTTSAARLAELKDAIESGNYEIDSTALAEAILKEDLSADGGEG